MSRALAAVPAELFTFRGGAAWPAGTLRTSMRRASWLYGAGALGDLSGGARFGAAVGA